MKSLLFRFILPLVSVAPSLAMAAIYGSDDRRELDDEGVPEFLKEAARSTAALIPVHNLHWQNGAYDIDQTPVRQRFNMCQADSFNDQPSPAVCTGFLAGPDILVTAGHCMNTASICQNTAIVFGFTDKASDKAESSEVYFCKNIIAQEIDPNSGMDVAVVKLDRKVKGRSPLTLLGMEKELPVTTPLFGVSYPYGGPAKAVIGGEVRENQTKKKFFVSTLDGFVGNSGSPVFTESGLVEGIIVRGEDPLKLQDGCNVPVVCKLDQCRGEDVLKASAFRNLIPSLGPKIEISSIVVQDDVSGNGNGQAEPGETVEMKLEVLNRGNKAAKNIVLTLTAGSEHVLVKNNAVQMPSLKSGERKAVEGFQLEILSSAECRDSIPLSLGAQFTDGYSLSDSSFELGKESQKSFDITPNAELPDYIPNGQMFEIDVPEAPAGRKVMFRVAIDHPKPQQLIIIAKAPDGTNGYLFKNGITPFTQSTSLRLAVQGISGTFGIDLQPFNVISHFRAVAVPGKWSFQIKDVGHGTSGKVKELAVLFSEQECSAP